MADFHVRGWLLTGSHTVQPLLHVVLRLPLRAIPLLDFLNRRQFLDEIRGIGLETIPDEAEDTLVAYEYRSAHQIASGRHFEPDRHAVRVPERDRAFRTFRLAPKLHRPGFIHTERALDLIKSVSAPVRHLAAHKLSPDRRLMQLCAVWTHR